MRKVFILGSILMTIGVFSPWLENAAANVSILGYESEGGWPIGIFGVIALIGGLVALFQRKKVFDHAIFILTEIICILYLILFFSKHFTYCLRKIPFDNLFNCISYFKWGFFATVLGAILLLISSLVITLRKTMES